MQEQLHLGTMQAEANVPRLSAACIIIFLKQIHNKKCYLENEGQGHRVQLTMDHLMANINLCKSHT